MANEGIQKILHDFPNNTLANITKRQLKLREFPQTKMPRYYLDRNLTIPEIVSLQREISWLPFYTT